MKNDIFYNEVLIDHNLHPLHKEELEDANLVLEGVNPSCGDEIIIQMKVKDNIIENAAFTGVGCAVSMASTDIMVDMIIGKEKDEALHLAELFLKMIRGEASRDEVEELDEAGVLQDISHMPSRVKCAVMCWHTAKQMLTDLS